MGIWGILGVISALLSVTLGYITWFEKRRDKKLEKQRKEEKKEREEIKEEVSAEIIKVFDSEWINLDTEVKDEINNKLKEYVRKDDLCDLTEAIQSIDERLEDHFVESLEGERDRLASEILNYHQDLTNRLWKSQMSYDHIHKCYRRYKKLDGNSFIDETFNEIVEMMRIQNEIE